MGSRNYKPISKEHFYHVTARSVNREFFRVPITDVWRIMEDSLFFAHKMYGIEILSFVLMSNHIHMILKAPNGNLSQAMGYFLSTSSKQIGHISGRINQTYGGRFKRCMIPDENYLANAYKYVYQNPIAAKICEKVEDYPYSTLSGLLGKTKCIIPLIHDPVLFGDTNQTLEWLNQRFDESQHSTIRMSLRKNTMSIPETNFRDLLK